MPIIKQCANCGKTIKVSPSKNSQYNFCNRDCYNQFHKAIKTLFTCEVCGKKFESSNTQNANRFCSRECYNHFHAIKNKRRQCPTCKKFFIAKSSEDKYCSRECYDKNRNMPKGSNHWNWKNVITSEDEKLRKSSEYLSWRDNILTRDKHQCVYCRSSSELNAHHIYSWKFYPNLRFELNNGITVCKKCHINIHKKFGYISKRKNDFMRAKSHNSDLVELVKYKGGIFDGRKLLL